MARACRNRGIVIIFLFTWLIPFKIRAGVTLAETEGPGPNPGQGQDLREL